jgi:hypothetical protein
VGVEEEVTLTVDLSMFLEQSMGLGDTLVVFCDERSVWGVYGANEYLVVFFVFRSLI